MAADSDLEKRIDAIERRNSNVTLDKAWETSWTRRGGIMGLTYVVVLSYLFVIGNDNPWVNACVPPAGFILSTLALSWLRKVWQKNR